MAQFHQLATRKFAGMIAAARRGELPYWEVGGGERARMFGLSFENGVFYANANAWGFPLIKFQSTNAGAIHSWFMQHSGV